MSLMRGFSSPYLLAALALTGCATSLSSFQPAHVPPKGHLGAEGGADISVPTGSISTAIDAGKTLTGAASSRMLTDDEKIQVFEAGVNLILNPPSVVEHVGLTYTPIQGWEVGLRYAAGAWRLGGRHQILEQARHGVDLTVGLGAQRFTFEFPVKDVIGILELEDFVRWNIDVPIVFGTHGDFYRLWAGPRLVYSRFDTHLTLHAPAVGGAGPQTYLAGAEGSGFYVGGQGGAAFGYKVLFVAVELTVVRFFGSTDISALGRSANVDLGSFVIYPGFALMGEF